MLFSGMSMVAMRRIFLIGMSFILLPIMILFVSQKHAILQLNILYICHNNTIFFTYLPLHRSEALAFVPLLRRPFTALHAFEVADGHQVIAVRILKTTLNLDKDIVFINCYVPHNDSPQLKHITLHDRFYFLSTLCQDISGSDAYIVLGGDFNAHCCGLGHDSDNTAGAVLRATAHDNDMFFLTGFDLEDGDSVVHTYHQCNRYGDCRGSSRPDHTTYPFHSAIICGNQYG
jgi:hypothetical protein